MTDPADSREIELKLRIPPEALPRLMRHRLLQRSKGGVVRERLVSTYFDTPDFRLLRAAVALRVRKIGNRRVQTVKCAPTAEDGINSRREWEQDVAADRPVLKGVGDKRMRKLLSGGKIRNRLAPQFVTDIQRATYPVQLGNSRVELAVDIGEIKTASGRVSICEAELELKAGKIDGIYKLAKTLHKSVPFTLEGQSKAARGFALIGQGAPKAHRADPLKLPADATLAEAFMRIGRHCLLHLRLNETAVRSDNNSEAVHQMRVGLRRLRSALAAFRELLPPAQRRKLGRELRWIGRRFSTAREWDVFHRDVLSELLRRTGSDRSLAALVPAANAAREAAYAKVTETLSSQRYTESLLQLEGCWESGAWRDLLGDDRDEKAEDYARHVLRRLHRRLFKLGEQIGTLDEVGLHQLRLRAKKLRYSAEFFRTLFPTKATKSYLAALADVQEKLGSLNDGVTTKQLLAELEKPRTGLDPAVVARASGLIAGWTAARVKEDLGRLPDAWRRFEDTRPFWK